MRGDDALHRRFRRSRVLRCRRGSIGGGSARLRRANRGRRGDRAQLRAIRGGVVRRASRHHRGDAVSGSGREARGRSRGRGQRHGRRRGRHRRHVTVRLVHAHAGRRSGRRWHGRFVARGRPGRRSGRRRNRRSAGRRPRGRPGRGARRGPGRGAGGRPRRRPRRRPRGRGDTRGWTGGRGKYPRVLSVRRRRDARLPGDSPPVVLVVLLLPRDVVVVVRPRGGLVFLGFTRRGTTSGIERGVVVHRVLRSSLAQPRVDARAGGDDFRSRASNPKRAEVLHLHRGGRGGRAARRVRRVLLLVPLDGFLELRHPLQLLVGRDAHALVLLQLRQLRAERPDVSALERIFSRLFALRLVLRDLLLPLLSAMRVAGGQSFVALRGGRKNGDVSGRRGAWRVEETLRIADFV